MTEAKKKTTKNIVRNIVQYNVNTTHTGAIYEGKVKQRI